MIKKGESLEDRQGAGDAQERALPAGAFYAQAIFDMQGVPQNERSRLVERVLGLAYSAAHRRVKGQTPWTVDELEVVANHFGQSLDDVFIAAAKSRAESATMVVGDLRLKCQLWVGSPISRPPDEGIVAIKEGARWLVVPATEGLQGPVHSVRQCLVESDAVAGSRIAVLDDQANIADSLCVFLRQAGFKADSFYSIDALTRGPNALTYDAYVLDWIVGDTTVGKLVEELRRSDTNCPIAILTGKANERGEVVADIADLVAKHDVRYFSKPLDPHMITAVLARLIATRSKR